MSIKLPKALHRVDTALGWLRLAVFLAIAAYVFHGFYTDPKNAEILAGVTQAVMYVGLLAIAILLNALVLSPLFMAFSRRCNCGKQCERCGGRDSSTSTTREKKDDNA